MGTSLTGTTPQDTYDSLIKVTDNGPLTGSLKKLTDGLGNDSSLSLSTAAASFSGTLAVTGNATFDTNTLFVDAAANEVGIGTITPAAKLDINQTNQLGANDFIRLTAAATTGSLSLGLYPSANNSLSFLGSNALYSGGGISRLNASAGGSLLALNTDSIIMYVSSGAADPVERAAFTANGLTFNGDTAAANALDDYEEGTWTPTVLSAGYTLSTSVGTYTKIGRQFTLRAQINFSAVNALSSSSVQLAGLPFVAAATFAGAMRDDTTSGAVYAMTAFSTSIFAGSYSSIITGSARPFAINENYVLTVTCFV